MLPVRPDAIVKDEVARIKAVDNPTRMPYHLVPQNPMNATKRRAKKAAGKRTIHSSIPPLQPIQACDEPMS